MEKAPLIYDSIALWLWANGRAKEPLLIVRTGEKTKHEARIHESRSRVGTLTIGDLLTLLLESRTFLERFPSWSEYEAASQRKGNADSAIAADALQILEEFAAEGGPLTEEAQSRVREFVEDRGEEELASAIDEGFQSTAENLTAAAAQTYIDAVADEGKQLAASVRGEVRKNLAHKIAELIGRNSDALVRFATARGARWFDIFLEFLNHQ